MIIDGLWGLAFGNGGNAGRPQTLYFTAGPNGQSHGLFGSLDPVTNQGDDDQGENHQDDNGNDQGNNQGRHD